MLQRSNKSSFLLACVNFLSRYQRRLITWRSLSMGTKKRETVYMLSPEKVFPKIILVYFQLRHLFTFHIFFHLKKLRHYKNFTILCVQFSKFLITIIYSKVTCNKVKTRNSSVKPGNSPKSSSSSPILIELISIPISFSLQQYHHITES